jgi:glutamine synthetase
MDLGVKLLPKFLRDTTDRNRTSPFAFTGMKFEFRALGSSMNISTAITVLNTIVADSMQLVGERIEAERGSSEDFNAAVLKAFAGVIKESRPVFFEGNNYSEEWVRKAEKRGLLNEASSVESLKAFVTPRAIDLFERQGVFSKVELESRYVIWLELYEKVLDIEARALMEMVNTQVLPNAYEYQTDIGNSLDTLNELSGRLNLVDGVIDDRKTMLEKLSTDIYFVRRNIKIIDELLEKAEKMELEEKTAFFFSDLKPQMEHVRSHVDALEKVMPDSLWQLPKYREMLFIG